MQAEHSSRLLHASPPALSGLYNQRKDSSFLTDTRLTLVPQLETLDLLEWSRLCQHVATFAATKLGAIAARQLAIPTTQAATEQLLAQTQDVYDLETRLPSGLKFDGIRDIGEALERAGYQGILSGQELLDIATTLAGARTLRRLIDGDTELRVLPDLVTDLRTYPELEQAIHHCIDDRGQVMDRASPKLGGVREQLRQCRDRIYTLLHKLLQNKANAIQEAVITQRAGRFVVPVKAPQKDAVPGIVHDTSMSGATLYIEPQATINLNNQLRQLERQEEREEAAVRQQLTEQVAAVKPDLERLLAIVTTLDLATARARYSLWLQANPPRFIRWHSVSTAPEQPSTVVIPAPAETITLRQLYHPLLVWQQQHEQGNAVVPIDLLIQPHIRVVAITGPNTGGKTVTLKTLGLAMLMAKAGLFVPAREPVELPWFDQVLADIGDEQSIEQSLSTFSGHIRRIVRILAALHPNAADNRTPPSTLVLLDEVGAGTDPSEGSALAIALLQHLADHAALTMATTHFGELKALKYQDDRFENASVEFDDQSLSPTYRLLWGIPGRSNALTIAHRLGLAEDILQQAQTYVGGASQEVNDVIAGLEAQRRRQEAKSQEANQLLAQTERLYQDIARKATALKEREESLKANQEQAIQAVIADAKAEIAKVIRQLQQAPTAQAAQRATEALNQLAEQQLPSRQPPAKPKPGFCPQPGDRVRIPRLGQTAEVLTAANTDDELTVRFGLMKLTIPLSDVESLTGEKAVSEKLTPRDPKPAKDPAPPLPEPPIIRTSHNTIDLRGSRVADAEPVIEQALAQGDRILWIVHGIGTGKLRQGIHAFLKQHPLVDRFELAPPEDGGAGATLVYLR